MVSRDSEVFQEVSGKIHGAQEALQEVLVSFQGVAGTFDRVSRGAWVLDVSRAFQGVSSELSRHSDGLTEFQWGSRRSQVHFRRFKGVIMSLKVILGGVKRGGLRRISGGTKKSLGCFSESQRIFRWSLGFNGGFQGIPGSLGVPGNLRGSQLVPTAFQGVLGGLRNVLGDVSESQMVLLRFQGASGALQGGRKGVSGGLSNV